MKSLSFNGMAELYDETRVFNTECLNSALDYIIERFPPSRISNIFYPGIGTGRIAIPLAERGYRITGIDISGEMLALLKKRLENREQLLPISFQQADVLNLPFQAAAFDMAIAVHLFYFIKEWRQAVNEISRVIRGDRPIVLMHTGAGTEIPFLNTRYKELCAEQGFPVNDIGVNSTREVVEYFKSLGYDAEWIRDKWQWVSSIMLAKALNYIEYRAYSFTTIAPDDIHSRTVEMLSSELKQQFGNLTTEVEVSNQIYLAVIAKSDK